MPTLAGARRWADAAKIKILLRDSEMRNMAADSRRGRSPHSSRSPLISFWNIGGSNFQNGWSAPWYMRGMQNWQTFIEQRIEPEYEAGTRRWILHNPFGRDDTGPMAFDQYLRAPEHGFDWLVDDFYESWAAFLETHPDVEVVVYLGKLDSGPYFEQYRDDPARWHEHAMASMSVVEELGVSVVFDAVSEAEKGSRVHRFIQDVESRGTRVYIEAWPLRGYEHMGKFNIVCAERNYQHRVVDTDAGMDPKRARGEVVRLINRGLTNDDTMDQPDRLLEKVESVLEAGHSAAFYVRLFL